MKFDTIVLSVIMHQLTERIFDVMSHFQDGGHDLISHRNVLPSGVCATVHAASLLCPLHVHMEQHLLARPLAVLSTVPDP